MDPRDTLKLLDKLEKVGLNDAAFRRVHQFGGRIGRFRQYCGAVQKFRADGGNHLLHQRLQWLLDHCENGTLPQGKSFDNLVRDAFRKFSKR